MVLRTEAIFACAECIGKFALRVGANSLLKHWLYARIRQHGWDEILNSFKLVTI